MFTQPLCPNIADYTAFIYAQPDITTNVLPTDSPWIQITYDVSLSIVALHLARAPVVMPGPSLYVLAVYNLGMDRLVNFCPDQLGQSTFEKLRQKFELYSFKPGVIASTGDVSTSASYLNPEVMKNLSLLDLQTLKTPWGRTYMSLAQQYGGVIWALT